MTRIRRAKAAEHPPSPTRPATPTADPVARERRRAARARDLAALLKQRPDLTGVHPPADLSAEAIHWSA